MNIVCFDLDDTLYYEWDYVRSGYRAVARRLAAHVDKSEGEIVEYLFDHFPRGFGAIVEEFGIESVSVDDLVDIYRNHRPDIALAAGVEATLLALLESGTKLVLITDGRSATQRLKIEALGLGRFFTPDAILVSEEIGGDKNTLVPWLEVERRFACPGSRLLYVGDNPAKDFRQARMRGWRTAMLLAKCPTVHPQSVGDGAPDTTICNVEDVLKIL